jgi:hypothetical protein
MDTTLEVEPTVNPVIRAHGQIAEMALPEGWVEAEPYRFSGGMGTRSLREIFPPNEPQARLYFYYRGLPMNEMSGMAFNSVLEQPRHRLTAPELKSLNVLLEDKSNDEHFTITVARTETVNRRRVLIVAGRYSETDEYCYEMFVAASGDGRTVQQIYFQAPKRIYKTYLKAARESMKSIEWKTSTN